MSELNNLHYILQIERYFFQPICPLFFLATSQTPFLVLCILYVRSRNMKDSGPHTLQQMPHS